MLIKDNGRYKTIRTRDEQNKLNATVLSGLTEDEANLVSILLEQICVGKTDGIDALNEYRYKTIPVSMAQFIDDPYYLGQSTQTLYPKLREDLISLFSTSTYREAIFTGSIGFGKTTVGSIIVCRYLYELSCLRSPQLAFGMSPGSEMTIALMSKTKELAKKVLLEAVRPRIELCPYFKEKFPITLNKWEFLCPNHIRVVVASCLSDAVLGMNVFMAVMDEMNFLGEKRSRHTGEMIDIASKVYTKLVRRIKSRYMTAGGDLPSILVLLSSAGLQGSFTDERIKKVKDDPHAFVRDYATWDVKPLAKFSGESFSVLVGSGRIRSKILTKEEEESFDEEFMEETGCDIIKVPEEYREDFKDDLDEAIKDLAGISVAAIAPYIHRKEKIQEAIDGRVHPFTSEVFEYGQSAGFIWDIFTKKTVRRLPGGFQEPVRVPILNPEKPRFLHIDPSLSGDSLGMAMGHIDRWTEVVRRDFEGKEYNDIAPHITIDFMLSVKPPKGDQIFLADIRRMVYELIANGFKINGFSADSYQSADMIQQMKSRGIRNSKVVSVDTSMTPYESLQSALYENRISFYEYNPFLDELEKLIHDKKKNKIDHPPNGSKDVADAIAGVVIGLISNSLRQPVHLTNEVKEDSYRDEMAWVTGGQIQVDTVEKRERASELIARSKSKKSMPFIMG